MPHVITHSCCSDASCVYACPVNCIHPTPDEPDFHAHPLNRKFLCGHDQVGSIKLITDTHGNEIKAPDYDRFGNIIEDTAPHLVLPLGFSGALTDSECPQEVGCRAADKAKNHAFWLCPSSVRQDGGPRGIR